jgi:hypothetical protein
MACIKMVKNTAKPTAVMQSAVRLIFRHMFRYAIVNRVPVPPLLYSVVFIFFSYSNRRLSVMGIFRALLTGKIAISEDRTAEMIPEPMITGISQADLKFAAIRYPRSPPN